MYFATTLARRKLYKEAADQYLHVVAHQPDNVIVLSNLAVALQRAMIPEPESSQKKRSC